MVFTRAACSGWGIFYVAEQFSITLHLNTLYLNLSQLFTRLHVCMDLDVALKDSENQDRSGSNIYDESGMFCNIF